MVGDCVDPEIIAKRLLQYWTDRASLPLPMHVCEILKILFLRKSTLPKYIHHQKLFFSDQEGVPKQTSKVQLPDPISLLFVIFQQLWALVPWPASFLWAGSGKYDVGRLGGVYESRKKGCSVLQLHVHQRLAPRWVSGPLKPYTPTPILTLY